MTRLLDTSALLAHSLGEPGGRAGAAAREDSRNANKTLVEQTGLYRLSLVQRRQSERN